MTRPYTADEQAQDYELLLDALEAATKLLRKKVEESNDLQVKAIEALYEHKAAYNKALLESEEKSEAKRKADAELQTMALAKAADIAKILASSSKDRVKAQSKTVENVRYRIDIKRSLGAQARAEAQLAGRGGEA